MSYILATDRVALAIKSGKQTQDRRPVKDEVVVHVFPHVDSWDVAIDRFAPWQPGDLLYVREAHRFGVDPYGSIQAVQYRADMTTRSIAGNTPVNKMLGWYRPWRPNIHHCKAHARTWVRVKRVWVERVRDISEADAQAEGFEDWAEFGAWWANQYGGRAWWANPYVWCREFEREEQGR